MTPPSQADQTLQRTRCDPLLVFVVATMAVPVQLSIVPMFIVMSKLGWTGQLQAVIVPGMVTAFGVFWMTQYLETALPTSWWKRPGWTVAR